MTKQDWEQSINGISEILQFQQDGVSATPATPLFPDFEWSGRDLDLTSGTDLKEDHQRTALGEMYNLPGLRVKPGPVFPNCSTQQEK